MSFKPTKWKVIISLVVLVIVHIIISSTINCFGGGFCFYLPDIFNDFFSPVVSVGIVGFLVVYIALSLIQKPTKSKSKRK